MRDSSLGRPSLDGLRAGPSALVEREGQLASLSRGLTRAREGRRGMLLVTGAAGLGKTSLLEAFLLPLLSDPEVWIARGECVEHYGAGEPYLPVLDALGRLGRLMGPDITSVLERHAPQWLLQLPGLTDAATQARLEARLCRAAPERMLRELAEALEVLSARHTLVFSFEDLHWCDPSTCSLLMFLARRREPSKLLIVATLRPDEAPEHVKNLARELSAHGWAKELSVPPLSAQGVRSYLEARLSPGAPDERLVARLHERTGGNALFLAQSLDTLLADGALLLHDAHWVLRDDTERHDPLPKSIEGLALKRIEALPPALRTLIEVASVAGTEFTAAELTGALNASLDEVESRCAEIMRDAGMLEDLGVEEWPDGTISARYRFAHALLHEAIYNGLEQARRVRLHRQIGERLALAWQGRSSEIAPVLRRHFEAGRDFKRALVHAEEAAQVAIARHAAHETVEHLTAALTLLEAAGHDPAHELSLRSLLGSALISARGWTAPEVLENYTRAHSLCRSLADTSRLAPILRGLLAYHQVQGELSLARGYADALIELSADQPGVATVQAHTGQLGILIAQGEYVRVLHHACEALAHYAPEDHEVHVRLFGALDPAVSALSWAGIALWALGFPDAGARMCEYSMAWSDRVEHPFSAAFSRYILAILGQRSGEETSLPLLEKAVELSERAGYPFLITLTRATWVGARIPPEQAAAHLDELRALVHAHEASGVRFALPGMLAQLARAQQATGGLDEAASTLERASRVAAHTGQTAELPALYLQAAQLTLQRDPAATREAARWLTEAARIARTQQALSFELQATLALFELDLARSRDTAALPRRAKLMQLFETFDEGFESPDLLRASRLLRALPRLGPSPRRGLVANALEDLERRAQALLGEQPQSAPASSTLKPAAPGPEPEPAPAEATHGSVAAQVAWLAHAEHFQVELSDVRSEVAHTMVREGEYWTLRYDGRICRVKDARGMGYLAQLIAVPHQEVHVLDLSMEPAPEAVAPEHAREVSRALGRMAGVAPLDAKARAAYEARSRELLSELEEARRHQDLGRLERLEHEREMLEQELTRAFGLGGRARASGAPAERARINVTRAIKSAIRKIAEHHPELGHHLSVTIRTGTFCVYSPDPSRPVAWHVTTGANVA